MNMTEDFRKNIYLDMIAILLVALSHGQYDVGCREATSAEKSEIMSQKIFDEDKEEVFNPTRINRATPYLLARTHTKY
ncbi:BgTH12-01934 [Blumeria graminis f. sp. triticale]|uniref:BgTH12-01934 n=1 Tax=Blumeria graminis f. sp. triticale TaxID=1689686 RepID=A0A9W4GDL8_BLUGR|nr:BgTH12-01934 [Blumeria graminis f. sp. triticale]